MKVILIGNSSIDKTKEVGFQIDNDFDLIVRMNRYQTEGFENYIGSKTHIWSLNRAISVGQSRVHYNGPDCDLNNEFKRRQELHRELDKNPYLLESSDTINHLKHKPLNIQILFLTRHRYQLIYLINGRKMKIPFTNHQQSLITIHYLLERHEKIYIHNFDNGKSSHYWEETDDQLQPHQVNIIGRLTKLLLTS